MCEQMNTLDECCCGGNERSWLWSEQDLEDVYEKKCVSEVEKCDKFLDDFVVSSLMKILVDFVAGFS